MIVQVQLLSPRIWFSTLRQSILKKNIILLQNIFKIKILIFNIFPPKNKLEIYLENHWNLISFQNFDLNLVWFLIHFWNRHLLHCPFFVNSSGTGDDDLEVAFYKNINPRSILGALGRRLEQT